MRWRLRIALMLVAAAMLAGMATLVVRAMRPRRMSDLAALAADYVPHVAQRIQNFHRVAVRDGRKVWEVAARDARYFERERKVVVRRPMLKFYLAGGGEISVEAEEGTVWVEGRELRAADVRGSIELTLDGYRVKTNSARYDRATGRITAPEAVVVEGEELTARGAAVEIDIADRRLRLLRKVEMELRPRDENEVPAG